MYHQIVAKNYRDIEIWINLKMALAPLFKVISRVQNIPYCSKKLQNHH